MGEDKEIELLTLFLNVDINLSSGKASLNLESEMNMEEPAPSTMELALARQYEAYSEYDYLIEAAGNYDPAFSLISMSNIQNYRQFYDEYFHRKCCICNKMGILALCLFCGDAFCCSYCGPDFKELPNQPNHSNLMLLPSWLVLGPFHREARRMRSLPPSR